MHRRRKTGTAMTAALITLACCCLPGSGNTDSFEQLKNIQAETAQGTPENLLFDSWARTQAPGGQLPDQFTGSQVGGTISAGPQLTQVGNPPANNNMSMPATPDPHPTFVQQFTVRSGNPGIGHFGPPGPGDIPFHEWNLFPGSLSGVAPATMANAFPGTGAPPSDYVTAGSILTAAERLGHSLNDPSYPTDQAAFQGKLQQAEQSSAATAQNMFTASAATLQQSLINVANEQAGVPVSGDATTKTIPQAIWMVQQLFNQLFLPMAVLLVLPGAIITQTKTTILSTFRLTETDQDQVSAFTGIIRAIVAVFMIPATQLIVSYSVDLGNSMTYEVQNFINNSSIASWVQQQTTGTPASNPQQAQQQDQSESTASSMVGSIFNQVNMLLNYGLTVLIDYQLIMMSYLFLMGPIAAAFFAWPQGVGSLFKPLLGRWFDAVTNLALWRFWWCVILLIMSTRIQWLSQLGQYNPQDPWEKAVYTSFMVMLMYVPFNPFEFKPGDYVDTLLQKAGVSIGGQQ